MCVVHGLSPPSRPFTRASQRKQQQEQQKYRQQTENKNKNNTKRQNSVSLRSHDEHVHNNDAIPDNDFTAPFTTTRRSFVNHVLLQSSSCLVATKTTAAAAAVVGGGVTFMPTNALETADDDTTTTITTAKNGIKEIQYQQQQQKEQGFVSDAFPKAEYTNSIVASRDTNVSPKEVYDSILSIKPKETAGRTTSKRALDVGAGAGVSTQVLYDEMGYTTIDALDWSGDAWDLNVVQNGYCPPSVQFYELDDERFYKLWKNQKMEKYDVIVFNFAVNKNKAFKFAKELLKEDGLLLAPINTQTDYWLKQTYVLLTAEGKILWTANDVGAWSVQFQPDVTQDTCQGIWCPPYNGFKKQ